MLPKISSWIFTPSGSKGAFVTWDELVGTLVDMKLLLCACHCLTVMRLCLLDQNHVGIPPCCLRLCLSLVPRSSSGLRSALVAQLVADLHADDPVKRPGILHLLVLGVRTTLRLRGYTLASEPQLSDPCFFDQRVQQARRRP